MLTVLGIALAIVVALLGFLWVVQRKLIYLPNTQGVPPAATIISGAEEVSFLTEDGLRLGAWFVPAAGADAATVLVFNGNAADRSYRAGLAETLRAAGFHVLLFDYRGYAGNPGSPTETGLAADARAAVAYLLSRDDVDASRVIYLGESLGAGVAIGLAVERQPVALVLRSPFTSLVDAAHAHFPFVPAGLLLRDRYPNIDRIRGLSCPVLVVAGEADTIVPPVLSRRLYEAAAEPKRWVTVPGVDHNDPELGDGDLWLDEMLEFLEEVGVLPGGSAAGAKDPIS